MKALILHYLEEAKQHGETWESDGNPNDVVTAQDLIDWLNELEREKEELRQKDETMKQLYIEITKWLHRFPLIAQEVE